MVKEFQLNGRRSRLALPDTTRVKCSDDNDFLDTLENNIRPMVSRGEIRHGVFMLPSQKLPIAEALAARTPEGDEDPLMDVGTTTLDMSHFGQLGMDQEMSSGVAAFIEVPLDSSRSDRIFVYRHVNLKIGAPGVDRRSGRPCKCCPRRRLGSPSSRGAKDEL